MQKEATALISGVWRDNIVGAPMVDSVQWVMKLS